MAEIKNNFVKSKMNKDLDDRLLSNGEYRNAQNVNINRSEGEDVGALENVLGNRLITSFGKTDPNLEAIGVFEDDKNERIYLIATNYTDTSSDELSNPAPYGSSCYILMYDKLNNVVYTLVQGRFLNFSKTHPVFGIDLIEELLFWTDNRNQPRKINVEKAILDNTYYTNEDQISVAKYYPYSVPTLWSSKDFRIVTPGGSGQTTGPHTLFQGNAAAGEGTASEFKVGMYVRNKPGVTLSNPQVSTGIPLQIVRGPEPVSSLGNIVYYQFYTNYPVDFGSSVGTTTAGLTTLMYPSSQNVTEEYLPPSTIVRGNKQGTNQILVNNYWGEILKNMLLVGKRFEGLDIKVTNWDPSTSLITFDKNLPTMNTMPLLPIVQLSWPNPNYISSWPGDKEFLTDKFVRFAYRFKFDDGEYSLISPFTQPAFIPKQNGYINQESIIKKTNLLGDYQSVKSQEDDIQASTIVSFFENSVDQVNIRIETPFVVNELANKLKVSEIEILYKQSDGLAIQVLDNIPITDNSITSNATTTYNYVYQSRKPFRTLPEKETLRVSDKVPIRALSQSVSGNRVIYGNFIDKHTPPQNLNYNAQVSNKYLPGDYSTLTTNRGTSFISYPTHTLKQNRTYQIGVVLSDRYGRQSDVILSSITNFQVTQGTASGSFDGSTIFNPYKSSNPNAGIYKWFGDSLKVLFRDEIPETVEYATGYPGLYKSGQYTAIVDGPTFGTVTGSVFPVNSVDYNISVGDIVTGVDSSGSSFARSIIALNTNGPSITMSGTSLTIDDNAVLTIHGEENKLGWYTYKIVVKQQAQEYYNAYLPNLARGTISGGLGTFNQSVGFTTLLSDNINKIPSDITEVQPEQTQFRTSDAILFPRFGGSNANTLSAGATHATTQYYIGEKFNTVDTIAKITDLGIQASTPTTPITSAGVYDAKSNPTVARLSLYSTNVGLDVSDVSTYINILSGIEIKPQDSRLEIYWETSTSGLISELNNSIRLGLPSDEKMPEDDPVVE